MMYLSRVFATALIIAICGSPLVHAGSSETPNDTQKTSIGIEAALNLSKPSENTFYGSKSQLTKYAYGVFVSFPMGSHFAIQPEIL